MPPRREELRIKDARICRIDAHRRPRYSPTDRLAILELRAAHGWSVRQTADVFHVSSNTVASWMKRLDEDGADALVQLSQPVNRFPDFVRYMVARLKLVCPSLGKVKIAEILSRAGMHLAPSTVRRILKQADRHPPPKNVQRAGTVVTADWPNHVWHVDLTAVPTASGFWTAWAPQALPQRSPFCWWVAVVVDHFSRRIMGIMVFASQPDSQQVRAFLGRCIHTAATAPKYLICDKGAQFWNDGFKAWCRKKSITPRFGAVHQHGSIAVVERAIQSLKDECTRRILIPLRRESFRHELCLYTNWFNEHRPHMTLDGRTPDEVYFDRPPHNEQPRIEPRARWPDSARCASPQARVESEPSNILEFRIDFEVGRKHLPVVSIRRAA